MKNQILSLIIISFCLISTVFGNDKNDKMVRDMFIVDLENILFEIDRDNKSIEETGYANLTVVYYKMIDSLVSKYPDKLVELNYIHRSCSYGNLESAVKAIMEREKALIDMMAEFEEKYGEYGYDFNTDVKHTSLKGMLMDEN